MTEERFFEEEAVAGPEHERLRLDRFAAAVFADYSRSFLQKAIRDGEVTLNGAKAKPSAPVATDDVVRARLPALVEPKLAPELIPLDILYEDGHLLAINKQANLVCHPAKGAARGTLANALLAHCQTLSDLNGPLRPGIVHRLDRDTTGVILAAKTNAAHAGLAAQFQERTVEKHYAAIVRGRMEFDEDEIALAIGRDPRIRERMTVRALEGREARSRYFVQERFERHTFVRVRLFTGRTHQARVHLAAIGHPVLADAAYGGGDAFAASDAAGEPRRKGETPLIARQALHAEEIAFRHPVSGEEMRIQAPMPKDMRRTLEALRQAATANEARLK